MCGHCHLQPELGTITYTAVRAIFDPKPHEGYIASPFILSTGITAPFDVAIAPMVTSTSHQLGAES